VSLTSLGRGTSSPSSLPVIEPQARDEHAERHAAVTLETFADPAPQLAGSRRHVRTLAYNTANEQRRAACLRAGDPRAERALTRWRIVRMMPMGETS
jgi:hypothetical protein